MKHCGKKFLAMLLVLCLLVSSSFAVFAAETGDDGESGEILERVNDVCNGLPYHHLEANGWGSAILEDGSVYISGGGAWKCKYCSLVMVTEGDIYWNGTEPEMQVVGNWALADLYDGCYINDSGVSIFEPHAYGYCGSSHMDGYTFNLKPYPYSILLGMVNG